MSFNINENNIQTAFSYKPSSDEYVYKTVNNELQLKTDNIQVKYFEGEKLFCVDTGYSIDGDISKMKFTIDDLTVYANTVNTVDKLKDLIINNQAIYIVTDDINFKSIIFIPIAQLNKTLKYTITSLNSTLSSYVIDEIAKKFNSASIATEASQVSQDNSNGLGDTVQIALNNLANRIPIPLFVDVYPEDDGTFDDNKRPANYFKKVYGITTVWKQRFNTTGAFPRYQGGNSNENRNGLIQGDAIREISGTIAWVTRGIFYKYQVTGAFYVEDRIPQYAYQSINNPQDGLRDAVYFKASKQVPTGSENRSINLLKETWELVSINGINIQDLLKS